MCGQRRSGCGILVWWEVGEGGLGESGGQAWSEQLHGARLEVELGGEVGLDDERLGEGEVGQGGLDHQMGVHGCLHEWRGKHGSSGLRRAEMCNGCVGETR
jgi:hypothetical protein